MYSRITRCKECTNKKLFFERKSTSRALLCHIREGSIRFVTKLLLHEKCSPLARLTLTNRGGPENSHATALVGLIGLWAI
jgi:hypothetical protein